MYLYLFEVTIRGVNAIMVTGFLDADAIVIADTINITDTYGCVPCNIKIIKTTFFWI